MFSKGTDENGQNDVFKRLTEELQMKKKQQR